MGRVRAGPADGSDADGLAHGRARRMTPARTGSAWTGLAHGSDADGLGADGPGARLRRGRAGVRRGRAGVRDADPAHTPGADGRPSGMWVRRTQREHPGRAPAPNHRPAEGARLGRASVQGAYPAPAARAPRARAPTPATSKRTRDTDERPGRKPDACNASTPGASPEPRTAQARIRLIRTTVRDSRNRAHIRARPPRDSAPLGAAAGSEDPRPRPRGPRPAHTRATPRPEAPAHTPAKAPLTL